MVRCALVLLVLAGCTSEPRVQRLTRAAGSGDGATDAADASAADVGGDASGCGAVTYQGCCSGQILWWCESGTLRHLDCAARPKCGWGDAGLYDCNTSGAPDPSGQHALDCFDLPDAGPVEAGPEAGGPCGAIGIEGCCDGTTLKYCDRGVIRKVSCALNPTCGWFAMGQYYDCGTDGLENPLFPRLCPGAVPTDAVPDLFPTPDVGPADATTDAGDGGSGGDCSCALGRRPGGGLATLLLLGLLIGTAARRR
jgi:hypothetical protein